MNDRIIVGTIPKKIIEMLNLSIDPMDVYQYPGVKKHITRRHPDKIGYLDDISEIIKNPDYIGKHPSIPNSLELVKVLDDNILVSICLNKKEAEESYLYVSSLYDISDSKVKNRLKSGRLLPFD